MSNKKLFVGNLPSFVNDQALSQAFAEFGNVVTANVVLDKFSGRSRGFGFVEMSTPEEAVNATEKFNGAEWEGKKITVNEARPPEKKPRTGGFGGDRGGRPSFGGGGGGRSFGGGGGGGDRGGRGGDRGGRGGRGGDRGGDRY